MRATAPAMDCDLWREAISARADGEDGGIEPRLVDGHLATCARCRAFSLDVHAVRRAAAVEATTEQPDLAGRVVRAVQLADRRSVWWVLRVGLGVVAVQVLVLSAPALLLGHSKGSDAHAARHIGSFAVAYAIGLLVVALRPAKARGMLPLAAALAVCLAITAVIDVAGGHVPVVAEAAPSAGGGRAGVDVAAGDPQAVATDGAGAGGRPAPRGGRRSRPGRSPLVVSCAGGTTPPARLRDERQQTRDRGFPPTAGARRCHAPPAVAAAAFGAAACAGSARRAATIAARRRDAGATPPVTARSAAARSGRGGRPSRDARAAQAAAGPHDGGWRAPPTLRAAADATARRDGGRRRRRRGGDRSRRGRGPQRRQDPRAGRGGCELDDRSRGCVSPWRGRLAAASRRRRGRERLRGHRGRHHHSRDGRVGDGACRVDHGHLCGLLAGLDERLQRGARRGGSVLRGTAVARRGSVRRRGAVHAQRREHRRRGSERRRLVLQLHDRARRREHLRRRDRVPAPRATVHGRRPR